MSGPDSAPLTMPERLRAYAAVAPVVELKLPAEEARFLAGAIDRTADLAEGWAHEAERVRDLERRLALAELDNVPSPTLDALRAALIFVAGMGWHALLIWWLS